MRNDLVLGTITPHGEFRDVLFGTDGQMKWETPWQSNVIVDGFRTVLAELILDHKVINQIAIGEGNETWDSTTLPPEKVRVGRSDLYSNELDRQIIKYMKFIDEENHVSQTPTQRLEFQVNFTEEDQNKIWSLREFALFAFGEVDKDKPIPGTGIMINHCVHKRRELRYGDMLQRTIRLSFEEREEAKNG